MMMGMSRGECVVRCLGCGQELLLSHLGIGRVPNRALSACLQPSAAPSSKLRLKVVEHRGSGVLTLRTTTHGAKAGQSESEGHARDRPQPNVWPWTCRQQIR